MKTLRTRLTSALLFAMALPMAAIAGVTEATQAPASDSTQAMPSVVLVHGAFADGSSWN